MSLAPRANRDTGPTELFEVSVSAHRRWLESPDRLEDKCEYRPPTLAKVAEKLSSLNPKDLGVGAGRPANLGSYELYQVKRDDTLSAIANRFYKDYNAWPRLFAANLDQLEDADYIHPGQLLKIPQP
jgi:nucleoid-associated protein YgaU